MLKGYAHYCIDTDSIEKLRIAPFHLLVSDNKTYFDRNHEGQMSLFARLADAAPGLMIATAHRKIRLEDDDQQCSQAIEWWRIGRIFET
jgi:protein phosphatase